MRKLLAVLVLFLLVSLSLGCLNRAEDVPLTTSAASTDLRLGNQLSVNQSEYAAFTCQLNVTRGPGLDSKEIHWFIDNVQRGSSFTQWGYATLNLSTGETQELSIGKHILKASFDGDSDYSPSNATAVFQVRAAPTPTPTPSASPSPTAAPEPRSITLNEVKLGSTSVSGTFSKNKNDYIYIFVKPQGNDTWRVQSPIIYLNGTFSADMDLAKPASYDVVALITNSHFNDDTTTKLPPSVAESSRATMTVR